MTWFRSVMLPEDLVATECMSVRSCRERDHMLDMLFPLRCHPHASLLPPQTHMLS